MKPISSFWSILRIFNGALGVVFVITGILNFWLVHPVPGIFYLLLSFVYLSPLRTYLQKWLGVKVALLGSVVIGLVVLWGTLAVTDLAEILGL